MDTNNSGMASCNVSQEDNSAIPIIPGYKKFSLKDISTTDFEDSEKVLALFKQKVAWRLTRMLKGNRPSIMAWEEKDIDKFKQ